MSARLPVLAVHARVDRATEPLERRHRERLSCNLGCADCCVDEITVFRVEADRIVARHEALLRSGTPHAPGRCAFLDANGGCRIYEDRPYVCRTQGLPLRWTEDSEEGWVELRDICPLNDNDKDAPLETLAEEHCWTLGPSEAELAQTQEAAYGDSTRVSLRSLFQVQTKS